MESYIAQFFNGLLKFLVTGASDWRLYFIHIGTWALIHYVKSFWDHLPPFKRRRLTEICSGVTAAILTAWSYESTHPYYGQIVFFMGIVNPSFYKLVVAALNHFEKTKWICKALKPKKYYVSNESHSSSDETVVAIREDGEKTVRLTKKDMKNFRDKWE